MMLRSNWEGSDPENQSVSTEPRLPAQDRRVRTVD